MTGLPLNLATWLPGQLFQIAATRLPLKCYQFLQSDDLPGTFTNFVKGKNQFLPIPQFDLDINSKLSQNPGY